MCWYFILFSFKNEPSFEARARSLVLNMRVDQRDQGGHRRQLSWSHDNGTTWTAPVSAPFHFQVREKCIFEKCIFEKGIFKKCIFEKRIFEKCIFEKCHRHMLRSAVRSVFLRSCAAGRARS